VPPVVVAIATAVSAAAANTAALFTVSSAVIEGVSSLTYAAAALGVTTGALYGVGVALAPKLPDPVAMQTPLKQSMPVRQSAFGTVRVAGAYMLFCTGSVHPNIFYGVQAHLDGESDALVSFYLNDDLMAKTVSGNYWWAPGAPGKYGGGGYNEPNLVKIDYRLGVTPETAYPISADVPAWAANHRGDGITSSLLRCTQARREDQSADFPNGVPQLSAVWRTQKVYDPRDGGQTQGDKSTYLWSDNPVLCLLAFLTDASGGMALDYARFILPAIDLWNAAADECDGLVATNGMHASLIDDAAAGDNKIFLADTTGLTIGATVQLATEDVEVSGFGMAGEVDLTADLLFAHSTGQLAYWPGFGQSAAYRCNLTYAHDTPPGDVIKSILSSFDGWLGQRGDGALVVRTNTIYDAGFTLSARHIVGFQLQNYLPDEQAVNQYVVAYTDPASGYNRAEAGYVEDLDDIGARGQVRSQDLYLQTVPSAPQALAVARPMLDRANQDVRGTLTCNFAGLAVMGHRYVPIQIVEAGETMFDGIAEITGKPNINTASMTVSFPWVAASTATAPAPPIPTRVQECAAWNSREATFPTAPTADSVLVALGTGPTELPVNTADGWALIESHEGIVTTGGPDDTIWGVLAWRRAGASESTTQTPFTGSATDQEAVSIIEIANCGDLPGALESLIWASPASPGSGPDSATATTTTTADNDLGVAIGGWYYIWPYWGQLALNLTPVSTHGTSAEGTTGSGSSSTTVYSIDLPTAGTTFSATAGNGLPHYHMLLLLMVFSQTVRDTLPPLGPPSGSPLQPLDAPTIISVTPDYLDSGGGVSGARLVIEVDDPGVDGATWKAQWKQSTDTLWTQLPGPLDAEDVPPLTIQTGLIAASGSIDVQVAYVTASQVSPWSASTTVAVAAAVPSGIISSTNVSASFTTTAANSVYYVDTASVAVTVTLHAAPAADEIVEVWDSTGHAETNPISFDGNGKNIAGAATVPNGIQANFGHARLIYDGTQWLMQ
jgi:hypothetical protein